MIILQDKNKQDVLFGMIGLLGGILCAISDIIFDFKGTGNVTIGSLGIIESNWKCMSEWRFTASIILASASIPMYCLGLLALKHQIDSVNNILGKLFGIFGYIGSCGAVFIHTTICLIPIIFKTLKGDLELSEKVINAVFTAVAVPFFIFYACLVVGTSIVTIIAILKANLQVPKWFVLLNPLFFLIIGRIFKVISPAFFSDLPAIFMPSLGLGFLGLVAIFNANREVIQQ